MIRAILLLLICLIVLLVRRYNRKKKPKHDCVEEYFDKDENGLYPWELPTSERERHE